MIETELPLDMTAEELEQAIDKGSQCFASATTSKPVTQCPYCQHWFEIELGERPTYSGDLRHRVWLPHHTPVPDAERLCIGSFVPIDLFEEARGDSFLRTVNQLVSQVMPLLEEAGVMQQGPRPSEVTGDTLGTALATIMRLTEDVARYGERFEDLHDRLAALRAQVSNLTVELKVAQGDESNGS